jgi:hypothetical protein
MDDLLRALPAVLKASGESAEVCEAAAMVAWRKIVGDALRPNAVPFRLFGKTLIVSVADKNWQRQLEKISGQLLFKLNSLLGQAVVTYIEFRIDPVTVKENLRKQYLIPKPTDSEALSSVTPQLEGAGSYLRRTENRG